MDYIKKIYIYLLKDRQALKIRSNIIPIVKVETFSYDADITKPYSFTIVNTGTVDMLINGVVAVKGANANSMDTLLNFPRVGIFKRNDIIKLTGGTAIQPLQGFIREDLELTG